MTAGCLLDSNVLLYLSNPAAPEHAANGVTRLLTFNTGDFPPEPGIVIVEPLA